MSYDLKALDFDAVRRILENMAATPYGKEAARNLEPAPNVTVARQMQAAVTRMRKLLDENAMPEWPEVPNVKAALRQAANLGAALNPQSLYNLQLVLQAAQTMRPLLETYPELYHGALADFTPPLEIVTRLDEVVQGAKGIKPGATKAFERLHHEHAAARTEAEQQIRKLMSAAEMKACIRDRSRVVWQGERVVLAVMPECLDKVKGARRGNALGGQDQLIEPMSVVAINNQLEKLSGQLYNEQQKILREVTAQIAQHLPALEKIVEVFTWLDLAYAGGRFSQQINAHAPALEETAGVELRQAYHPILLIQFSHGEISQPVPLSLQLSDEQRFLLITGPNTGGKTVALKTLGLLVLMAQCGLHLPAEGDCRIGWYRSVMVDMGDRQSLYHHLSTFAGHVESMKRILAEADDAALLLLDELGTGTDPDEGAALAMAVMDEFVARRSQGIVNTHLAPLKNYGEASHYVNNAAMRFDTETLAPTYELQIGKSGVSMGLTIAERNGLATEIVARAREHLSRFTTD